MGVASVGGLYRLRVYCQSGEQGAITTNYAVCTAITVQAATDQELAAYWDANVGAGFIPAMAVTAEYRGVSVRNLTRVPKTADVFNNAGAGVGTAGAVGLPTNTAGLIRLKTGLAGRGMISHAYIPFPSEDDNELAGVPDAAYRLVLGTISTDMSGTFTVPTAGGNTQFTPVIWHGDGSTTFITDFDVATKWSHQDRRAAFGRPNTSPI